MRRVIFLALLIALICVPAYAQRGGGVENPVNLLPLCTATSGSCPAQDYFCHDSDFVVWHCNSGVWNDIKPKKLIRATSCAAYTAEGQICWDSDNDVLYIGDGTTAQPITGGGGSGTSTIQEADSTVSSAATTLDFRSGFDLTESPVGEVNISLDLTEPVTMGAAVTSSFALSTLATGNILIYDGSNSFDNKVVSGDVTITSEGVTTIGADKVALTTDTTGNYVSSATESQGLLLTGTEAASLGFIDCAANEIMKRNVGDTAWECGSDSTGSGGSPVILDIGDDGGNDSADLTEIATNGDTNSIVTMPLADKLYMDMSANWPGADLADLATALAANGANCSAGSFPLGVDASGAAETCTDAATQAELDAFVGSANIVTLGTVMTGTWTGTAVDATYLDTNTVLDDASNTFSTGLQVIDGDTDEIQLRVQGNATQTADVFVVEKSDGTDLFTVDNTGNASFGGTTSAITAQAGQDLNITAASGQAVTIGDGGSLNYVNVSAAGAITFSGTADIELPNNSVDAADVNFNYATSSSEAGEATSVATDGIAQATDISTDLCSNGQILKNNAGTWECAADSTGGTPAFTDITNGTNTGAAMVVGTGASLTYSGSGSITASALSLSSTPTPCSAGNYPLGISTTGASASCTADDDVPEAGDFTNLTGGDGITNTGGTLAVDINATLDGAGSASSLSGMEFTATNELALLQGCAEDDILKWNDTTAQWGCEADAGASGGDSVSIDSVAVTDPDFVSTGDIDFVDTSNTVTANINAGVIVNADVNTGAAIAASKLAISATSPIALSGGGAISITDVYVNSDADDTMVGDLTIDDADVGTALTVRSDSAAAGATVGILITTDDDDSANFDPFEIRDDSGVNNDLLFAIDHTGTVTTGIIPLSTLATTVTVSDDESTNDEQEIVFTTDNTNLESDGTMTYNPSSGTVTATAFAGSGAALTAIPTTALTTEVRSMYWGAGAMEVDGTGCTAPTAVALVTNGPTPLTIACGDSDTATISGSTVMPDAWNAGTVVFEVSLGQISAGTTVFDMDFEGQCIGSDEPFLAFAGTGEQSAAVTLTADDDALQATTAAVTLNGTTCAVGDVLVWRGAIDGTGGNTSVGTEVVIVGVKMEYTTDIGD